MHLKVESADSPFTRQTQKGQVLRIRIAHGEGNYFADEATIESLNQKGQVLLRYSDEKGVASAQANPNGSRENIAGICNARRNVFGLMPHPERASEAELGSTDGLKIFKSILEMN